MLLKHKYILLSKEKKFPVLLYFPKKYRIDSYITLFYLQKVSWMSLEIQLLLNNMLVYIKLVFSYNIFELEKIEIRLFLM